MANWIRINGADFNVDELFNHSLEDFMAEFKHSFAKDRSKTECGKVLNQIKQVGKAAGLKTDVEAKHEQQRHEGHHNRLKEVMHQADQHKDHKHD